MQRKTKAATETGVYIAIIAVILVVANVISYFGVRSRLDMTKTQRFTLSNGSAHLVASLNGQLHVDAYITKGMPKLDAFVRDLTELLKLYAAAGKGKFDYTFIEAKSDEQRQAAKEAGLKELAFGEGSETGEDQASIAQGYMGIVLKYGSEKQTIPTIFTDVGLEFWITNKIRELRDKEEKIEHKIGVVTNKDEIKIADSNLIPSQGQQKGPSMRMIVEQNFPFYKFVDVDLKDGETEIDKELDGLIITQPGKDYNDKELRRIDQFLMHGGKALTVYASAVNLKGGDGSMKATLSTHNLEKLLAGYGVEMKKDAALDWARSLRIPVPTQMGTLAWIREPGVVQVQHDNGADEKQQFLDDSFPAFFRLDELSFPFPSTLVQHPDKQPEAKMKTVARTSPAAWSETGDTVDLKIAVTWRPKPPPEQKDIAIVVDGTLKSAMGSGDGVDVAAASASPSKVLVVSSAQFLANPFARSGAGMDLGGQFGMMGPVGGDEQLQMIAGPYAQKYLEAAVLSFKNTLDWMSGDSDLLAASAKILHDANLTYGDIKRPAIGPNDDDNSLKKKDEEYRDARKNSQRNVQWTLTLICPVLFAGIGIFRWRKRESDRDAIKLD